LDGKDKYNSINDLNSCFSARPPDSWRRNPRRVGINDVGANPANEPSRDQSFCRAKILLIDEFSLGLAPLVVEHDIMAAFKLANRGLVFESEKVIIRGPTMELAHDPTVRKAYMVV
jgi:hypothetical protein